MRWTVTPRQWHRKRPTYVVPAASVRTARRGAATDAMCGQHGFQYRYARVDELPIVAGECPLSGQHEYVVCPADPQFPICAIHAPLV